MPALANNLNIYKGKSTTTTCGVLPENDSWQTSSIYLSIPYVFSDKIAEMFQKLKRISQLNINWDTYSADAPNPVAVLEARSFLIENHMLDLPFYFIAPGANGEVMIEFQKGKKAAELYFLPSGQNELVLFEEDEVELEGNLDENFREFIDFFTD